MRNYLFLFLFLIPIALIVQLPADAQQRKLDTTSFVVLGEGLAAGMADFGLREVYQDKNFPSQMARQMNTAFPQPLIQNPGIGNVPGFPPLPVRAPGPGQGAVRKDFPPALFVFNLSVPGFRVTDSINRRPSAPLVQQYDMQQTVTNLILGYPALILKDKPIWTQLEYARKLNPTFIVIELGYYDVLEAAATGNLALLPDAASFKSNYSTIVKTLKDSGAAEILLTTVPDPMDTGYFTTLNAATRLVRAPGSVLASLYKLRADDLLTVPGITAVANQIDAEAIESLPPNSVLSAASAAAISQRVRDLNAQITSVAQDNGVLVYDLQGLFSRIRNAGLQVATRRLTSEYLGGFYSLDGYYPGRTGHALIANEMLSLVNRAYGTEFPLLDLNAIATDDPSVRYVPAGIPSREALR